MVGVTCKNVLKLFWISRGVFTFYYITIDFLGKVCYNRIMNKYILECNDYLSRRLYGRYSFSYDNSALSSNLTPSTQQRVTQAILILKNRYNKTDLLKLKRAKNYIKTIAKDAIQDIIRQQNLQTSDTVIVCVPRSKANFTANQLLFRKGIWEAANEITGTENGVNFIERVTNTKTTHLRNTKNGDMSGDGADPYPGITRDTCVMNGSVRGKIVILVDDIYTKNVNVDEDCCQFLLEQGARAVILYTICKTGYN